MKHLHSSLTLQNSVEMQFFHLHLSFNDLVSTNKCLQRLSINFSLRESLHTFKKNKTEEPKYHLKALLRFKIHCSQGS